MEVWQAIRKDAESGAKQLVSEYGDRLFAVAVVLCRNDHQAEDLVFRTFERAVRKIGRSTALPATSTIGSTRSC